MSVLKHSFLSVSTRFPQNFLFIFCKIKRSAKGSVKEFFYDIKIDNAKNIPPVADNVGNITVLCLCRHLADITTRKFLVI